MFTKKEVQEKYKTLVELYKKKDSFSSELEEKDLDFDAQDISFEKSTEGLDKEKERLFQIMISNFTNSQDIQQQFLENSTEGLDEERSVYKEMANNCHDPEYFEKYKKWHKDQSKILSSSLEISKQSEHMLEQGSAVAQYLAEMEEENTQLRNTEQEIKGIHDELITYYEEMLLSHNPQGHNNNCHAKMPRIKGRNSKESLGLTLLRKIGAREYNEYQADHTDTPPPPPTRSCYLSGNNNSPTVPPRTKRQDKQQGEATQLPALPKVPTNTLSGVNVSNPAGQSNQK